MSSITIRHTHADGTILQGSHKGDGVYEIVSRCGFTWRRVPGIFIQGSRDKVANRYRIEQAAEALRAAGHEVAIEIDDTPRDVADVEADRAERAAARAERLRDRSDAAAGRSQALYTAGKQALANIPFGQPILADHYSANADRNYRARAVGKIDRSFEEAGKAEHLAGRADAVEAHQRHRENPEVTARRIERLETELRRIERNVTSLRTDAKYQDGGRYAEHREPELARLTAIADQQRQQIDHWRGQLDEAGYRPWQPEHFKPGDHVLINYSWYRVVRVNRKTLTVPALIGLGREQYSWNDTVPYDQVRGRRRDGQQIDTPPEQ